MTTNHKILAGVLLLLSVQSAWATNAIPLSEPGVLGLLMVAAVVVGVVAIRRRHK